MVSGACTCLVGFVLGVCGNLIILAVFCLLGDKEELVRMLPILKSCVIFSINKVLLSKLSLDK